MKRDHREYLKQCTAAIRHIVVTGDPEFFPELTRFLTLAMQGLPGEIVLQHSYYQEGFAAGFEAGYSRGLLGLPPVAGEEQLEAPPAATKKKAVLKLVKKKN
jgi:hypothetical protein